MKMTSPNEAPFWTEMDGASHRMETCSEPAPFAGYMAYNGGKHGGEYHLLFRDEVPIHVTGIILQADYYYTHVWLEFEGKPHPICLDHQAYEVYSAIKASKKCGIIARYAGSEDKRYVVPVRIELPSRRPPPPSGPTAS